ncbi:hypothetical protein ACP3T3_00605 [Chryseobacterium sp. CBSDS_008]
MQVPYKIFIENQLRKRIQVYRSSD